MDPGEYQGLKRLHSSAISLGRREIEKKRGVREGNIDGTVRKPRSIRVWSHSSAYFQSNTFH